MYSLLEILTFLPFLLDSKCFLGCYYYNYSLSDLIWCTGSYVLLGNGLLKYWRLNSFFSFFIDLVIWLDIWEIELSRVLWRKGEARSLDLDESRSKRKVANSHSYILTDRQRSLYSSINSPLFSFKRSNSYLLFNLLRVLLCFTD